jgi:Ca-activated chloride channel family protein
MKGRDLSGLALLCSLMMALSPLPGSLAAQAPAVITENPAPKSDDGSAAGAPADPASVSFTLNLNVDLVELQVLATDTQGRHVTSLEAEDFLVTEDEVAQNVSLFRKHDVPVSLGLVIDNSRSMTRKKDRVDAAVLSFVEHNNPDDEAFLIHFDDTARLAHGFTRETGPLRRTLAEIEPFGQTALFDAVALSLETIREGEHKKKAVLVISDGADNASLEDFESVLEDVRQSGATVYTIGVFQNPSAGAATRPLLEALAAAGGGRAFFPETAVEVPALTAQIARELRDQYTLGYVPSNFRRDGSWRSVRVNVRPASAPGSLRLTYRHGYYAPSDTLDRD